MIGDQNSRRITPHLQKTDTFDIIENTYVICDAEHIKSDKKYNAANLYPKNQNIKVEKTGRGEATTFKISTIEKSGIATNKFIAELHPINRKRKETEL